MSIELAVFDMAGTTVFDGDAVNNCFRAALAAAGVQADVAAVNAVMGLPKPIAVRLLLEGAGRVSASTAEIEAIHGNFVSRMIHFYAHDIAVREVPGASATFAALRQAGIKVALNTGFSRAIVQVILDRLNWNAAIDASIASDEVLQGRPHPDMIFALMKRFGVVDARRVAKVGDTVVDLEEGTNAGCGLVIGVVGGACTREQLESRPHSRIVKELSEVLRFLMRDSI